MFGIRESSHVRRPKRAQLNKLPGMNATHVPRAALTAAPILGPLGVTIVAAMIFAAPITFTASPASPPVGLVASYSTIQTHSDSTALLDANAQYASTQRQSVGNYPLKRRRHMHFWSNFTHFGTSGGPLSWLVLGPILAITAGAAAVPFFLRRRMSRKRRAGDFVSPRPDVFTPPFGAPPPMPPPARLPGATDERLARLEKLHESGAVTDVEFLAQRQRILGG
jgi:hypothetical protein